MNAKQKNGYLFALKDAQDRFDKEITELGEKIRTEVIIPLCQKHNLIFTSGMGRFFFTDYNGHDYDDPLPLATDLFMRDKDIYKAVQPVLHLLMADVSPHQVLGYYVGDVK